ncbi:MAG: Phage head-tail joining protein [Burkholderiaceae bacterium]|nr:Phage head-tail joining protein [Burkholderiaceae bacterium]
MNFEVMNKRVTFLRISTSKGEYGGQASARTDVCTVWASVKDLSGRMLFAAQAVNSEVTTEIRIRKRADVSGCTEIAHGATAYEVLYLLDDGASRELVAMCKKVL